MAQAKVVFAGTPDFALALLKALVDSGTVPLVVLTQPDRPSGRGKKLTPSPVKTYAESRGIAVMQPASLRDDAAVASLKALQPDVMVVAAYGLILPQAVLDIPRAGCVNIHASLLPRWRGAAPIQAAILAGDEQTGVCLMAMSAGLDCGAVFVSRSLRIGSQETAGELHDRLAAAGGELLVDNLDNIVNGELTAIEQDESQATYAGKISTGDAALDWQRSAADLERCVRAYNPAPGAYFMIGDERIKCWRAQCSQGVQGAPGLILEAGPEGIVVACGDGALTLESLQRPGKRPVSAGEFAAQIDLVGRQL
jgi:methionyl-tRNA formyltransferase